MKNRNGFRAAGPDPGDDIFGKYLATIGTPDFPEIVPKEFQRKDRLLIWMEYELLHRDIIRRKKKIKDNSCHARYVFHDPWCLFESYLFNQNQEKAGFIKDDSLCPQN